MTFDLDAAIRRLRLALIVLFCSWGLIWYSIKADHTTEEERDVAQRVVVFVRDTPGIMKKWFAETFSPTEHQENSLNPDLDIRPIGGLQELASVPENLYLLHYRYESENNGRVLLQNIKTGNIAKTWEIPLEAVFKDLQKLRRELTSRYRDRQIAVNIGTEIARSVPAIRINAPLIDNDFSLYFNCLVGYAYKLDQNSQLVWRSEEIVHHSLEIDEDGRIWACSSNLEHPLGMRHRFREDAILCLDNEGKRSQFYSLSDILARNGLLETLLAATPSFQKPYGQDPYHLNDVQPVRDDGRFWKKGDLFLSIRNKSLVLQYRPKTDSIMWYQQGPWLAQHDVDVVGDSTISIFNNNGLFLPHTISEDGSNIALFDFANGTTRFLGTGNFASLTEGRQTITSVDSIVVEDTNNAVYHLLDSKGELQCRFYIPYYANPSNAMYPSWARVYVKHGDEFVQQ